jgi:hypothetical protein
VRVDTNQKTGEARQPRIAAKVAKLPDADPGGSLLLTAVCGLPDSSVSQWIWSQFTLADHVFVRVTNALYLIFKFAVAHRQSFYDNIRTIRHIQTRRKQALTNLEFVHDAHRTVSLYASN